MAIERLKLAGQIVLFAAAGAAALWALTQPGWAFSPLPSTPDIAVASNATADIAIPGQRADWVFIRNDCAGDVYFDLRDARDGATNDHPLRLAQDQQFSAEMTLFGAIEASPAGGNSACTITVIFAN